MATRDWMVPPKKTCSQNISKPKKKVYGKMCGLLAWNYEKLRILEGRFPLVCAGKTLHSEGSISMNMSKFQLDSPSTQMACILRPKDQNIKETHH